MAKSKVSEWDSVASNNIRINGIDIDENCPPSTINNAIREMMAQIKDWQSGSSGDDWTSSGVLNVTGSLKLDGNLGSNGQVLTSKGTTETPVWKTLGTMSNQNSNAVSITGGTITGLSNLTATNLTATTSTFTNTNTTGTVKFDGSTGSSGQVLTSKGGATPTWTTLGSMSTQNSNSVNITGGSLNVTGSFKLDNSTGSAGQVMVSQGSSATPKWGNAFVRGMIMLWSGSTGSIPSGWALCNGANGTPNLRDRFVVGAGGSYAVNSTGGATTRTTSSKSLTTSSKSVVVGRDGWGTTGGPLGMAVNGRLLVGSGQNEYSEGLESIRASGRNLTTGNHNHTVGAHNHTVDTRSPYYALCYIMKL